MKNKILNLNALVLSSNIPPITDPNNPATTRIKPAIPNFSVSFFKKHKVFFNYF